MKQTALSILSVAAIAITGLGISVGRLAMTPLPVQAETSLAETSLKAELAVGNFVTVEQDHATTGTATILQKDGQTYLELSETFDTARGPAVYVLLHNDATVGVELAEGDYVAIAPLESFDGKQRYAIPDTVDVADYGSVVIWCEEFNVTFGYATL